MMTTVWYDATCGHLPDNSNWYPSRVCSPLQEFASESEESETDVNIENEYYQAKAAKEDNPQSAIAGFERVCGH